MHQTGTSKEPETTSRLKIGLDQYAEAHAVVMSLFRAVTPTTDKSRLYKVNLADWKKIENAIISIHPENLELAVAQPEVANQTADQLEMTSLITMAHLNMETHLMEVLGKVEANVDLQAQGAANSGNENTWQNPGAAKRKPEELEVAVGIRDVSREHVLHNGTELEVKTFLEPVSPAGTYTKALERGKLSC